MWTNSSFGGENTISRVVSGRHSSCVPVTDAERILGLLELDAAIRRIDRMNEWTMIFRTMFSNDRLTANFARRRPDTHGASSEG